MKILIKECKKIMDIRVLLVIAVFTVLFYQLFLEVTILSLIHISEPTRRS